MILSTVYKIYFMTSTCPNSDSCVVFVESRKSFPAARSSLTLSPSYLAIAA